MQEHEWKFILESFVWNGDATFHLLQQGENDTYTIDTYNGKFILKRYRRDRYTIEQIRAELEWIDCIRQYVTVPKIIKNNVADSVSRLVSLTQERMYAVFEFIDGQIIDTPTALDYYHLGHLMRHVHSSADVIQRSMPAEWKGWNRPKYDVQHTVDEPLNNLLKFDLLTEDDKARCIHIAQKLRSRFPILSPSHHFIHADLHFGNVLVTPRDWYCLDFDECGFGHRAIDLGVIRLHLKNNNQFEELWTEFTKGYGTLLDDEELSLGTAIRIFYMAGKIPKRQDIDDLRNQPDERIRRYLGYVEAEIYRDGERY